MFLSEGSCFVALPEHVAGPLPKITISTAAPVVSDQATVLKPFWDGMDLAIAVPDQGVINSRCVARVEQLKPSDQTRTAREINLIRITRAGQEMRTKMQVTKRDYLTLEAEIANDGLSIGQGTSGAFAFVGSRPVGMAIESDGVNQARFIRAEEILLNVSRFAEEQGRAYQLAALSETKVPAEHISGIAIRSVTSTAPPTLPQFGPANVLSDGLFVTGSGVPFDVVLRLDHEAVQRVNRVEVEAEAQGYAVPNQIVVSLSTEETPRRFRFWTQGRMTPDGAFDTGMLAARNARWIRLRFLGTWTEGEIAVRSVRVE
ncbi:hypothetical protein CFI11_09645 [Thalassococcus sp. S3]|nr:hypothetical protein CFI11_09645 [Thalassococcus sp. S3]